MNVLPTQRLTSSCIASIQEKYKDECNFAKLVAAREFEYFYERSGAKSVAVISEIAGLSQHQYARITSAKSIPSFEAFTEARARLETYFGRPDVNLEHLRFSKRQRAAEIVLSETHKPFAKGLPAQVSTIARKVASLSEHVEPPTHNLQRNEKDHFEWLAQLRDFTGEDDGRVIEALSMFICAREYLGGFLDKIILQANTLADQNDLEAVRLREDITVLMLAHAAFRVSQGCLKQVRRNLVRATGDIGTSRSTDSDFITDLLGRWNLKIQDFIDPTATVGFLLIESSVVRPRVIHVLKQSSKTETNL